MQKVQLLIVDSNKINFKRALKFLDNDELMSLNNFKDEISRNEHLVSLLLKKKFIGKYIFNEYGKPISQYAFFNVSHSKGIVSLAITKNFPIGLDIEIIRNYNDDLVKYILKKDECDLINDNESFFKVWTNKESLVKCVGSGLNVPIKEIPYQEGFKRYLGKDYFTKSIVEDNIVISLTGECDKDFLVTIKSVKI